MTDVKALLGRGDFLFQQRSSLMSFLQDVSQNFYPERANFTVLREMNSDFAGDLTSSYPLLVRRELGDSISSMLRPRDTPWMGITIEREEKLDRSGREWCEWATGVQRRAMYDRLSGFVRATKEGDHDFAAFGQCVISRETDWSTTTLLFRCWHIRDVAWAERYNGTIGEIHRNWSPTISQLARTFGVNSLHENVRKKLDKHPHQVVKCRHVVIDAEDYVGDKKPTTPFCSLYIDVENSHVIRKTDSYSQIYTIPRWQTVSGSQYAYSPATVAGLPDARLLQAMTLTLLEAGEMAVRPPLIATREVIKDLEVFAGGVTWVDAQYDERLGEVLRPITQDKSGLPFGMDMAEEKKQMLAQAFYLNKLNLPPPDREMTAYETGQRIQEYIRNALPLFEPMEEGYNGSICEGTFDDLMRVGAFGNPRDFPQSVRGQNVRFKFESPLHQAIERQKGTKFVEMKGLLLEAAQLDGAAIATVDARKALRDALEGIGIEAKWMRDEDQVEAFAKQQQAQQQTQQTLETAQQGAVAAQNVAAAEQAAA